MSIVASSEIIARHNESHWSSFDQKTAAELDFYFNRNNWNVFHNRTMDPIKPLFKASPAAKWLTLGDGRWGQDAFYIQKFGVDTVASDIDPTLLANAHQYGFIKQFEQQNAERISHQDNSFDYVFTRNTLHHLPRPYTALYEMLRVARLGIIINEPQDPMSNDSLYAQADGAREEYENTVFKNHSFFFEQVGNYIYRFSKRELQKLAYGLGLKYVAFRGINDMDGSGFPDINTSPEAFNLVCQTLAAKDHFSSQGYRRFENIMAIIFTVPQLPEELREDLIGNGWELMELLDNPWKVQAQ